MTLPEFALETYFARWEFTARYNLTASDAQAVSLARLLELADHADRAQWESLALGYTPTRGAPSLRRRGAAWTEERQARNERRSDEGRRRLRRPGQVEPSRPPTTSCGPRTS